MDVTKYLLVVAVLIWILARGTEQLGYNWQWNRVPRYLLKTSETGWQAGPLLQGRATRRRSWR